LSGIAGCICGHEHQDHAKYIKEYLKAGIKCYINEGTNKALFEDKQQYNVNILLEKEQKSIGEFLVKTFPLEHDVQNLGFLIHHFESGLICYITDTNYCHYTFKGLNQVLIESNYSNEIIDQKLLDGTANKFVRDRVLTYHLEFETTKEFLRANDLTRVNNIILLHLSMGNSNANQFRREVTELTGKQVFVATQGLEIDLNKEGV
jgi:phosphoribosyl 1,2-cyclic phosphodiesterase